MSVSLYIHIIHYTKYGFLDIFIYIFVKKNIQNVNMVL